MKRLQKTAMLLALLCLLSTARAQDPDFHIYLCFGQSNMEGQGTIEAQDRTVDSRFRILQAVNCSGQTAANWRTATPPLSRCNTGIGPADNFGRTMVASLPSHIRVGVVHVAVAGCKIELFDKHNYASYVNSLSSNEQWMRNIINEYGGNPYARLVELAKIAQKDGVIKGILMHQGESNSGDNQWPGKVRGVYNNLLTDLGLSASEVPLLAGQVVDAGQGGLTAGMNTTINALPNTIPTAHVISSSGCTAVSDRLHFTTAGYRLLGERYAQKMLSLLTIDNEVPPHITSDLSNTVVVEHEALKLSIAASGPELSYQWYRNNQEIPGATGNVLNIPAIDASYNGSTFKVVIINPHGRVESKTITVTVTDFAGVKIMKAPSPVTIDGQIEAIWDLATEYELQNRLMTVDNDHDLGARVRVLYDDTQLYFLYDVTDDITLAASSNFWENDGIEIYIDGNNDKASAYDANDFQFVISYDASQILEGHNKPVTGIRAASALTGTGYIVEAAVPWSAIGVSPAEGKLLGMDFHVNDSDTRLRDGKITWFAGEDVSYSNPSAFGPAILGSDVITGIGMQPAASWRLYPNPANDHIVLETAPGSGPLHVRLHGCSGQLIRKLLTENDRTLLNLPKDPGIYYLIISNTHGQIMTEKIVKIP